MYSTLYISQCLHDMSVESFAAKFKGTTVRVVIVELYLLWRRHLHSIVGDKALSIATSTTFIRSQPLQKFIFPHMRHLIGLTTTIQLVNTTWMFVQISSSSHTALYTVTNSIIRNWSNMSLPSACEWPMHNLSVLNIVSATFCSTGWRQRPCFCAVPP